MFTPVVITLSFYHTLEDFTGILCCIPNLFGLALLPFDWLQALHIT